MKKRVYVKCPYQEKEQAKALGARWDAYNKLWYFDNGISLDLIEKWQPNSSDIVVKEQAPLSRLSRLEQAQYYRSIGFNDIADELEEIYYDHMNGEGHDY